MSRYLPPAWLTVVILGVAVVLTLLALWLLPAWIVEGDLSGRQTSLATRLQAIAAVRQGMLWSAGGLIAVVTLTLTWRRDRLARQGAALERDANFTNRYTEAIRQLGDSSIAIRLGGIYALERIAYDSTRDRQAILDVLAAYLRHNSPREEQDTQLAVDNSAAVLVLGRITQLSPARTAVDLSRTNLSGADLQNADLRNATLPRVVLTGADLRGADLRGADLRGAKVHYVRMQGADLRLADLENWDLRHSNISEVKPSTLLQQSYRS